MRKGQTYAVIPTTGRTHRYLLDAIPLPLWRQIQAQARTEQRSVRQAILRVLQQWVQPVAAGS